MAQNSVVKESILIDGKIFYYDAVSLSEESAARISFDQAKQLLFTSKKILEEENVRFSLVFGTLLGAIREHSFISHDYDIDIMVFDKDALLRAVPSMWDKGLKLCRVVDGRLYSFMMDGFYIDIYIVLDAPSIMGRWCYMIGSYTIWKRYLKEFETISFLGGDFLVPKDPEKIVEFWYGKKWRTPIPGYHGRGDVYPVYLYRKYLKKYIKREK